MKIKNALLIEWLVLRSRKQFWLALVLSLLVGILIPLLILLIHQQGSQGEAVHPMVQALGQNASDIAGRALWVSNLYIIPLLLLLIACESIATERSSNRLRDCALQPTSRAQLLWTKLFSHTLLAFTCACLTGIPALLIGLLYFQTTGAFLDLGLAYGLSTVGNIAIMTLGMLLSTQIRSAGFAAISTIILLIFEKIFRMLLQLSNPIVGVSVPESVLHVFPGHALEAWTGWNTEWSLSAILGLGALTTILIWALLRRFQKLRL